MRVRKKYEYGQTIGNYGCTYIAPSLRLERSSRGWFKCHCGKEFETTVSLVSHDKTRSCRCINKAITRARTTTHGLSSGQNRHKLYRTWLGMISRCNNTKDEKYTRYGHRGITVCDRWQGSDGFPNFLQDMGEKPSPSHTLDRIDNSREYSKENCRWATSKQQNRNTRRNLIIEYQGSSLSLAEWSELLNIKYNVLLDRISRRKWDVERAFTTPRRNYPR
jgi:hypothetical protein